MRAEELIPLLEQRCKVPHDASPLSVKGRGLLAEHENKSCSCDIFIIQDAVDGSTISIEKTTAKDAVEGLRRAVELEAQLDEVGLRFTFNYHPLASPKSPCGCHAGKQFAEPQTNSG